MSDGYDFPVPKGTKRGFLAAAVQQCEDCGKWQGYVGQVNDARTHARPFCSTNCRPTAELAEEDARLIANALETQRVRKELLGDVVGQMIGAVDQIKKDIRNGK